MFEFWRDLTEKEVQQKRPYENQGLWELGLGGGRISAKF